MNEINTNTNSIIFQASNGALELRTDSDIETIWASKKQISEIFEIDRSVVSKHIKRVFTDNELDQKVVCAKFAHTTQHGAIKEKQQNTIIEYYNLDIILAVGYRTNSKIAIQFRQWVTQTLKQHITKGFTINESRIQQNKELFLKTIEDLKILTENTSMIESGDLLSLIEGFSNTWFSLDKYDKSIFPTIGTKQELLVNASDLLDDIQLLKQDLIQKNEATDLFAQEKQKGSVQGILGTIYQTIFGQDAYETIEEKAAHLLYFIVKNHPFNDGNKRSGAFAFIWYLRKAGISFETKINPSALTALTLLIAESNPSEKDKMIGIVLLLLGDKE
ncbi:MAG: virulence protein RhuM/Fic/DOC family protein [Bacteroidia bacterium]|nr:virulence protein RhuM/Fic/DOC family protein [Bacteroidia bacterium]